MSLICRRTRRTLFYAVFFLLLTSICYFNETIKTYLMAAISGENGGSGERLIFASRMPAGQMLRQLIEIHKKRLDLNDVAPKTPLRNVALEKPSKSRDIMHFSVRKAQAVAPDHPGLYNSGLFTYSVGESNRICLSVLTTLWIAVD